MFPETERFIWVTQLHSWAVGAHPRPYFVYVRIGQTVHVCSHIDVCGPLSLCRCSHISLCVCSHVHALKRTQPAFMPQTRAYL